MVSSKYCGALSLLILKPCLDDTAQITYVKHWYFSYYFVYANKQQPSEIRVVICSPMAPSTRFELTTFRLGGGRSILLSYEGLYSFQLIADALP